MNFIMIGLLLRGALDTLCVRLNMYLVVANFSVYSVCVTAPMTTTAGNTTDGENTGTNLSN